MTQQRDPPGRLQRPRLGDLGRLLAATSAIALVAAVVSFWLLYATARTQQLDDMERAAETLAALMESVARFDAKFSSATDPQGSRGATMRQIEQGLANYIGRRGGEELVLGQVVGSRLQVLRATPQHGLEVANEIGFVGDAGRPLREAIEGRRGKGRFLDYRGVPVLAAYAPVPTLQLGIVYKTDVSAFDAPFVRAGAWAGAVYLGLVAALVTIYRRFTRHLSTSLDASEARYRRLHESLTDAFVEVTMDGRIVECNQAYRDMLGYTDDELRRLSYVDITPERWHEMEARLVREQILPRGASDVYEKEYRRKDGTLFPVELRTFLLRDAGGAPAAMWAIVRDISERRQQTARLQSSEARLNEAQRIARVGSWELDRVKHQLQGSDEVFRLFEIDPGQHGAAYEALVDAIHPDDRAAVSAAYAGSLRDRQPYRITHRLRMADGRVKHVEEQCETEFAPDGTPLLSRGTVQDVTERVLAEERIRQALQEKETLLREIHHRVKNNLQVVASLLHFHAKKLRDAASVEVFAEVRAQLRSMMLVHEKLYRSGDLARIDFGDYLRALVPEVVNARAANAAVAVKVEAADAYLPIETALPCGLLVSELLTNALKHAFPDARRGSVEVVSQLDAGALVLTVSDNGVGLPEGFDPAHAGTFGWQLVQGLAAQVGGTLDLSHERGTVVRVVVPLKSTAPSS